MFYSIFFSTKILNLAIAPFFLFQLVYPVNSLQCQMYAFYCPLKKKRCISGSKFIKK